MSCETAGHVQALQLTREPSGVRRPDADGTAGQKESLDALVAEALDHDA
jgi:hypothetical protein